MSTSVNGWPALDSGSGSLVTWNIPNTDSRLRLRHGSAGFLLIHLAAWFDKRLEDIEDNYRDGELDDWGYAYRPVRGYSSSLSNHSSGTAMDLNATEHPLGVEGTFSEDEERFIQRRLDFYAGCIRWGGDYRGRKDEMHFEINLPLAACERVARRLMDTPRGRNVLKANPAQRAVILS